METDDIIKHLALTIAHKEKVINELTRRVKILEIESDKYRHYWLEDSAELRRTKGVDDETATEENK